MFIYLQDLAYYMEGFSKEEINLDTISGEFIPKNLLKIRISSHCILVPTFDNVGIAFIYLEELNDKRVSNKLLRRERNDQFLKFFHVTINDYGLYYDYSQFCHAKKMQIAKDWCDEHNIKSTAKAKPI